MHTEYKNTRFHYYKYAELTMINSSAERIVNIFSENKSVSSRFRSLILQIYEGAKNFIKLNLRCT